MRALKWFALFGILLSVVSWAVPASADDASSEYIAPDAGTSVPVYDTAWQLFARASPAEADEYFATLSSHGFSGAWAGAIHHAPATYAHSFRDGGTIGALDETGNLLLSPEYITHVNSILDAANSHDMKVGLVAAWQNLYLPGGGADPGNPVSDLVRGTVTEDNAYVYGQHLVESFGDHPAVSMWVFGGDAGTNNTEENKEVWRQMAAGVRDAGSTLDITYHTPTSPFDQLNYAGEPWLDFISPETGHGQDAAETEAELVAAAEAYGLPVWQGEPRYFNINFQWVPAQFRGPGVEEVEADAIAARNAGVAGYVYGDAGRWHWCQNFGDSSPCDAASIAESFGEGEVAIISVFSPPFKSCNGLVVTADIGAGDPPTNGPDVILGTDDPDVINGLAGDDVICGGGGADVINGGGGIDTIFGGDGDDVIGGQGEADLLYGEDGDDRINGGAGNDQAWGGTGDDDLRGQGDDDTLQGGPGVDQFFGGSGNDTISTGDDGNLGTAQVVRGGGNDDVITGSLGDDDLEGGSGLDMLYGLEGDDRLRGGNALDRLWGGAGDDLLEGGAQRDFLYGGDDDDDLRGGSGNDDLFGESGDDTLNGQGETDLCDGGTTGAVNGDSLVLSTTCEAVVNIP